MRDRSNKLGSCVVCHKPPTLEEIFGKEKYEIIKNHPFVDDPEEEMRRLFGKPTKTKLKNCANCGAVLHGNVCEYCGTEY